MDCKGIDFSMNTIHFYDRFWQNPPKTARKSTNFQKRTKSSGLFFDFFYIQDIRLKIQDKRHKYQDTRRKIVGRKIKWLYG